MVQASKGKHAVQNLPCQSLPHKHHSIQLRDYHYSVKYDRWCKCDDIICENCLTDWTIPEDVTSPEELFLCNEEQPAHRITIEEEGQYIPETSRSSTPEPGPQTPKTVMTTTMTEQQTVDTLLQAIGFNGSLSITELQQAVNAQVNQPAAGTSYPATAPPPAGYTGGPPGGGGGSSGGGGPPGGGPPGGEPFGGGNSPQVDLTFLAAFAAALRTVLPQEEIARPEEFTGDVKKARDFVHQCEMYFKSKKNKFVNDDQKIRFMNSLMKDSGTKQPRSWATVQERKYEATTWPTWDNYKQKFLEAYKTQDPQARAMLELHHIVQKDHESVNEYNVHFDTLVAEALVQNPDADSNLLQQYIRGLRTELVHDILPNIPATATLSEWMSAALNLDNRMQMVKQIKTRKPVSTQNTSQPTHRSNTIDPNAMDVDAITTNRSTIRCYNCNQFGHMARECTKERRQGQNRGRGQWRGGYSRGRGGYQRGPAVRVTTTTAPTLAMAPPPALNVNAIHALPIDEFDALAREYYRNHSDTAKDFV